MIELIIVMAILAIGFTMAQWAILPGLKRQRLASKAEELKILAGRTLSEMQDRNRATFLVFGKYVAGVGTGAAVVVDTNGNGTWDVTQDAATGDFQSGADQVVWRVRLPDYISLSTTDPLAQGFNTQWFRPASSDPVSAALLCDFMGRANRLGTPPAMITGPATVQLCHSEMIGGSLTPFITYTLSIGPLFTSSLTRVTTGE